MLSYSEVETVGEKDPSLFIRCVPACPLKAPLSSWPISSPQLWSSRLFFK